MSVKYICGCNPAARALLFAVFCVPAFAQSAPEPAASTGATAAPTAQAAAPTAQAAAAAAETAAPKQHPAQADPFELLTLRLPQLFARFGAPAAVYAVRGEHEWQDDVVLEYPGVDFYIYKDQVWQAALEKAFGVSRGDPERVLELVFKNAAIYETKDRVTVAFNDRPYPAGLRFIIKNSKIASIYLYRAHY